MQVLRSSGQYYLMVIFSNIVKHLELFFVEVYGKMIFSYSIKKLIIIPSLEHCPRFNIKLGWAVG